MTQSYHVTLRLLGFQKLVTILKYATNHPRYILVSQNQTAYYLELFKLFKRIKTNFHHPNLAEQLRTNLYYKIYKLQFIILITLNFESLKVIN